ncbi:MAG: channel protein TolC, partial [Betaproteobacteria bacterium]|nr:channel protein TolC [Betaproteobacteria bacterium]
MLKRSALMCGLLVSVMSEPAPAADLISIYREARTADAVYAGARASYMAGQEKLPQGRSGILPAVTLSANTQYNDRDLQFRSGAP